MMANKSRPDKVQPLLGRVRARTQIIMRSSIVEFAIRTGAAALLGVAIYKFDMDPWKALPVLVAFFGVWIASLQYRLAREKLKLDLFEKRYKIFDATRKFFGKVMREGEVKTVDIVTFRIDTSDAMFLFGKDVNDYLEDVKERGFKNLKAYARLNTEKHAGDSGLIEEAFKEIDWMLAQPDKLANVFGPYLRFRDRI